MGEGLALPSQRGVIQVFGAQNDLSGPTTIFENDTGGQVWVATAIDVVGQGDSPAYMYLDSQVDGVHFFTAYDPGPNPVYFPWRGELPLARLWGIYFNCLGGLWDVTVSGYAIPKTRT